MSIELPSLPYPKNALEPHISEKTLEFHHGKHHAAYVNNLNGLIAGTELESKSLEEIILASAGNGELAGVFNNSAQVFNHTFYWNSLKPNGGGAPSGKIADLIQAQFGSYEAFKDAFAKAGATQFGSGWAWLVQNAQGALEIVKTANAETPITTPGVTPLLTMDVWEHAYYLDYQNRRPDYIGTFLNSLVNWDFANANLK